MSSDVVPQQVAEVERLTGENATITAKNAALSDEVETLLREKREAAEEHRLQQASLQSELGEVNRRCSEQAVALQQKQQDLLAAQELATTNEQKLAQLSQQLAATTAELREREAELQAVREKLQLYELGEKDSNEQRAEYIRRTAALQVRRQVVEMY